MAVSNLITAATNAISLATAKDTVKPYSYQEWRARNESVATNDAYKLYTAYVKNWFANSNEQQTRAIDAVKNYYKYFLLELGLSPRTQAEKTFFNTVNIDDDKSLQSVIVGYARRLKDVSVYIANKRNHIGYTKLKYNLIGTKVSIERLFYTYILTAFTQKTNVDATIITNFNITDPDILSSLPNLADISKTFSIEIQELYDTSNYLDRDPAVSPSKYISQESGVPTALYTSGDYDIPIDYLIAEVVSAAATAT